MVAFMYDEGRELVVAQKDQQRGLRDRSPGVLDVRSLAVDVGSEGQLGQKRGSLRDPEKEAPHRPRKSHAKPQSLDAQAHAGFSDDAPTQPPELPPRNPDSPTDETRDLVPRSPQFGPTATVWRQAGCSFLVPVGAPSPEAFRPSLDERSIAAKLEVKQHARALGIKRAFELLQQRDAPLDHTLAMMTYDCELAPLTTNREQLEAIGVYVPPRDRVPTDTPAVTHALWSILYGLARLGIYLSSTDQFDDRELLEKLVTRILNDEVRDIAPSPDMVEFIDLCDPSKAMALAHGACEDSDGLTGPFETGAELDDEDEPPLARPTPKRRDHLLPRPTREGWARSPEVS